MKKLTKQQFLKYLREYLVVTLAGLINAVSLFAFVNPATLVAGGFTGLSSALTYVFVKIIPLDFDSLMSVIYFIMNVPLLICALIFLRGDFTFKTIWATVVCTFALKFLPPALKFHNAPNARLIAIIFGGVLIGTAMYMAAEYNGSNGGTEVIAKIVSKYHPEIDLSKVIMIANFAISVVGSIIVIIVENESIAVIIYSLMYSIIGSSFMGMLKRGFNRPQKYSIITSEYDAICAEITTRFKRGYSIIDVQNCYDGKPKKMISVIIQYRQTSVLKQIIRKYDPAAFTIVKDIHDLFSRPTFNRSYKTK